MKDLLQQWQQWASACLFNVPKKPDKPNREQQILETLLRIEKAIGQTNIILRKTEANNERRHTELLAVLNPSASHIKFVFGKPELK